MHHLSATKTGNLEDEPPIL